MKTEKIYWKFMSIPPDLRCISCGKTANQLAIIGNFRLPVCSECGQKTETELMETVKAEVNG